MKVRSYLLTGCLCFFVSSASAEDTYRLYIIVKSKYPSLVACAAPKEFEKREIKEKSKMTEVTVVMPDSKTMLEHSYIVDGCSTVIYESKEKGIFYVSMGGGMAGQINRLFGPFRVDGSDL